MVDRMMPGLCKRYPDADPAVLRRKVKANYDKYVDVMTDLQSIYIVFADGQLECVDMYSSGGEHIQLWMHGNDVYFIDVKTPLPVPYPGTAQHK
jgi:hypothetical protein